MGCGNWPACGHTVEECTDGSVLTFGGSPWIPDEDDGKKKESAVILGEPLVFLKSGVEMFRVDLGGKVTLMGEGPERLEFYGGGIVGVYEQVRQFYLRMLRTCPLETAVAMEATRTVVVFEDGVKIGFKPETVREA